MNGPHVFGEGIRACKSAIAFYFNEQLSRNDMVIDLPGKAQ